MNRNDIKIDKDARSRFTHVLISSKLTATSYEGKSADVVKAMKNREKQLREKQIRALMEKKEEAKKLYGKKLDEWSCDLSGEKKNIRTLLTTVGEEVLCE